MHTSPRYTLSLAGMLERLQSNQVSLKNRMTEKLKAMHGASQVRAVPCNAVSSHPVPFRPSVPCACACVHVCVHVCASECVHAHMCACVHACVRACAADKLCGFCRQTCRATVARAVPCQLVSHSRNRDLVSSSSIRSTRTSKHTHVCVITTHAHTLTHAHMHGCRG